MTPTSQHDVTILRLQGYRHYPRPLTRPHCDLCGPFASPFLRTVGSDEFGTLYRCLSCDEED